MLSNYILIMYRRFNVIPILADILSDSVKEKVTRIILAVFRVSRKCVVESKNSYIRLLHGWYLFVLLEFD